MKKCTFFSYTTQNKCWNAGHEGGLTFIGAATEAKMSGILLRAAWQRGGNGSILKKIPLGYQGATKYTYAFYPYGALWMGTSRSPSLGVQKWIPEVEKSKSKKQLTWTG
jgi:hypothetical protein